MISTPVTEVAFYEDGVPVGHDGKVIFPHAKDLPKTHFPVPGWNLVRTGEVLPEVGQEIIFVKDVRGTQDEEAWNRLAKIGYASPPKDQMVMTGIVTEVGFSEEMQEHWITACKFHTPGGSPVGQVSADHITYWKPLGDPPEDTFKRSPYSHWTIFEIVQAASIELSKESK